jgi:hypothetical protein
MSASMVAGAASMLVACTLPSSDVVDVTTARGDRSSITRSADSNSVHRKIWEGRFGTARNPDV